MSADYQDTIAKYLARKENFSYALEVATAIEDAKAILRRSFWATLKRQCQDYLDRQERGADLHIVTVPKDGAENEVRMVRLTPRGAQHFSLCYTWEDEGGSLYFGLYYSNSRFSGTTDLFADVSDLPPLAAVLEQSPLKQHNACNPWALRWTYALGDLREPADLRRLAENPDEYASAMMEEFKLVFETFAPIIADVNRSLAKIPAPTVN